LRLLIPARSQAGFRLPEKVDSQGGLEETHWARVLQKDRRGDRRYNCGWIAFAANQQPKWTGCIANWNVSGSG
jgi:hypothetical protein